MITVEDFGLDMLPWTKEACAKPGEAHIRRMKRKPASYSGRGRLGSLDDGKLFSERR
jgi:hypothetical protein